MAERVSRHSTATLPLLTASEMRAWDERAIQDAGVPERVLMESAGRAAAAVLHALYPAGRVVAAVGAGNNGGDALVLLRALRAWGREVAAVPVGGAEPRRELLHGWEVEVVPEGGGTTAFATAGVLVDGILGTGSRGAPRAAAAAAVEWLNRAGPPVLALDGPTGVDLTTGRVAGVAVRADVTVAFGAPKRGLVLFPGRAHAGRVVVVEVGFPPPGGPAPGAVLITDAWAAARTPRLPPNAHKGERGKVVGVAGHPGMAGAAILVAMGALRAGAGGVCIVSPAANRVPLQAAVPEALFVDRASDSLGDLLRAADVLVVGPGMGKDHAALDVLRRALAAGVPAVVDADAVSLLAEHPELLTRDAAGTVVLTPHPGEMARLMALRVAEVVADPFGVAAAASERFGCAVLLKGFPSVVAAPGAPALVNVAGHSGIATGGMGDSLAGITGAILGLGCAPREAAALALYFAGRAAELAGRGTGLLPRDVAEALPAALAAPLHLAPFLLPGVLLDLPAAY